MRERAIFGTVQTEFGWIAVLSSEEGVLAVTLPHRDEESALVSLPSLAHELEPDLEGHLDSVLQRLQQYYRGDQVEFEDRLDMHQATEFQRRVWHAARSVPRGTTTTYGELAQRVGAGTAAARAVGRCMALNRWPPLVPCHRVLGQDGRLTGFAGGVDQKRRMLEMEGAMLPLAPGPDRT